MRNSILICWISYVHLKCIIAIFLLLYNDRFYWYNIHHFNLFFVFEPMNLLNLHEIWISYRRLINKCFSIPQYQHSQRPFSILPNYRFLKTTLYHKYDINVISIQDQYWRGRKSQVLRLMIGNHHRYPKNSNRYPMWRWPTVHAILNHWLAFKTSGSATNITSARLIATFLCSVQREWHLTIASKTAAYKPLLIAPNAS